MPKLGALSGLYDATDVFFVTDHRVNHALLRSWIQQRRIRTPLLDLAPGKPRLYWLANVIEIDVISLATNRGVNFAALGDPSLWLGPAIDLNAEEHVVLLWRNPDKPPETITASGPEEMTRKMTQFMSVTDDMENSLVVIDLSQRLRRLDASLMDRLKTRKENDLLTYPTLDEKLTELSGSHVVNRKIAEQIRPFVT